MVLEGGMQPAGTWGDMEDFKDNRILQEVEQERKHVLQLADRGQWASVLKILCQDGGDSIARGLPMNNFEDSILHLAASDGQTEVVEYLLEIIKGEYLLEEPANITTNANEAANITGNTPLHLAAAMGHEDTCECITKMAPELVKAKNAYGNTPLHLAAAMGLEDTCKRMAKMFPEAELAKARNADGETPIFMAALGGHKEVFNNLTTLFLNDSEIALARRNDGDTLLHCAISGEYFDLASAIIDKYQQLIYYRNDRGLTPLHLLANNPSAFWSGCQLQLLDHFFYYSKQASKPSIMVSTETKSNDLQQEKQDDCTFKLPDNYFMCWSFLNLWRNIFATLGGQNRCLRGALSRNRQTSENPVSVTNFFRLFFKFLLEVWLLILAIFGFSGRITEIRMKKWKHEWAKKVMKQILGNINHWWEFREINTGMDPRKYLLEWTRSINPGATLKIEHSPTQGKEIALEPDINLIQEGQQAYTAGPQPQEEPLAQSNIDSSTTGTIPNQRKEDKKRGTIESPFLIAGKKGAIEMVEEILKKFPIAIHDMDLEHKNILLLAAEHRQEEVYKFVLKRKRVSLDEKVDVSGNSILHLAAKNPKKQSLLIPSAVLHMQREIKWFKFVMESMPPHFSTRLNHKGQTAMEVFTETHQTLATQRAKWLSNASQSCSVVATLITTVAFATISSVPGGLLQESGPDRGAPVFHGKLALTVFSVSSSFALFFSAISLIKCLGILTSPYKDLDFGNNLPKKLINGLAFLFASVVAMFISFFCGDLFVIEKRMTYVVYPAFILASCLALAGFPLYIEFIRETVSIIKKSTNRR